MLPRTPQDSNAYIPPSVRKAMEKHMERAMPAHLKKYQDGRAYIPQHAQEAITQHMQKTVPSHMKEYVDPYVHQHVVFPSITPQGGTPAAPAPPTLRPPMPHLPRQDTFRSPDQQPWLPPAESLPPSSPVIQPTPAAPSTTPSPGGYASPPNQPSQTQQPTYDFIMNAGQQPAQQSALPNLSGGTHPLLMRICLIAGGLMVVFIIFTIAKNILGSGSSNKPLLIGVAQSQQQLIQLTTSASTEKSISLHNKNFAMTAELSLSSSQASLIKYLGVIGVKKVNAKLLNEKVSTKPTEELTAAAAADTYNQTFQTIMKTQLDQYQLALQAAYKKTTGPAGRKLLNNQYSQSQLLLEQLNAED